MGRGHESSKSGVGIDLKGPKGTSVSHQQAAGCLRDGPESNNKKKKMRTWIRELGSVATCFATFCAKFMEREPLPDVPLTSLNDISIEPYKHL